MADDNDKDPDYGALLAGGLIGLGAGLLAASAIQTSNEKRRAAFRDALASALSDRGVLLMSATFGRGAGNIPFWRLTLQDATGQLWSVRVPLPREIPPYSDQARAVLVAQLDSAA